MYNYIPHPSNCRVSSSVLRLLAKEGATGYGVYWMLLEMLRDAPEFKIPYEPDVIAYSLHLDSPAIVRNVCEQAGVFSISKDNMLWSPWLLDAMEAYNEKKTKLQEAGRKGAAKRWAATHETDGQAMATPSQEDGQAIAYNISQRNVTEQNVTLPDPSGSPKVDVEYFDTLCKTQPAGHAPGYVAQVCLKYGMTVATCDFICERSDNANVTNPIYLKFAAIVRRIQGENWTPKHPDGFFLKKLFE